MVYFGSGGDGKLYAVNGSTGTKIWEFETGDGIYSSPVIGADGTVYFGSGDGKLYSVNGSTGTKVWEFETGDGIYSSPAIGADGTVYFGSNDYNLYAVNGTTGTKIWEFETGGVIYSSPTIGADGTVYFGSDDYNLYAVNGTTGVQIWEFDTGDWINSSPVIASDGTIYFGSSDGWLYAINGTTGVQIWEFNTGSVGLVTPLISADGTAFTNSPDPVFEDGIAYNEVFSIDLNNSFEEMIQSSTFFKYSAVLDFVNYPDGKFGDSMDRLFVSTQEIQIDDDLAHIVNDDLNNFTNDDMNLTELTISEFRTSNGYDVLFWTAKQTSLSSSLRDIYKFHIRGPKVLQSTSLNSNPYSTWLHVSLLFESENGEMTIEKAREIVDSVQFSDSTNVLVYVGSKVLGSDDGKLYALNGLTGEKIWVFEAEGYGLDSAPTIGADGTAYLGTEFGELYAINGSTGGKIWEFDTDGDGLYASSVIGADGTVYVASNEGKLYAIKGSVGTTRFVDENGSYDFSRLNTFMTEQGYVFENNGTEESMIYDPEWNLYQYVANSFNGQLSLPVALLQASLFQAGTVTEDMSDRKSFT